jgi:hypothetical protein
MCFWVLGVPGVFAQNPGFPDPAAGSAAVVSAEATVAAPPAMPPIPPVSPIVEEAIGVLRDECVGCHRPGKSKGGLKLTTLAFLQAGGSSGAVVQPGDPAQSPLYSVLLADGDPHMPPKKQLAPRQVAAIKTWIEQGTPWSDAVMDRPPAVQPVALRAMPAAVAPVFALGFSPDGKSLAMARGGRIEIRDAANPQLPVRVEFAAHEDSVRTLAWSPDSSTLGTGGYQRVRFWDASSGEARGEIAGEIAGEVNALAWSAQGNVLWVGDSLPGRPAFVRRVRWPERATLRTWKAHDDSLLCMALSADGKWLATAGADKVARRWNAEDDQLLSVYEGHTNQVLSLAWDPVQPRLATSGADRELKVWDRDSREQDAVLGDKRQVFSSLAWSKNGARLVAVTDRGNGSVFTAIQKHTGAQSSVVSSTQKLDPVRAVLQSVAIHPDGSLVVGGASDGRFFVWKADTGKLVSPVESK